MLLFEIHKNGKKLFTVGAKEAEEYGVYLSVHPESFGDVAKIEASGYKESETEFFDELRWGSKSLSDGDEVIIRIAKDISPDTPTITKRHTCISNENRHSMLCSDCGRSEWETDSMISMNRVTLCSHCLDALKELWHD